jgi:MFS family permease
MIFNLLPLFLANVIGVRTVTIGLIEGLAETTSSLIKIFSGRLSDVIGQRKKITVAGYSLSVIAKPFLLLATSWVGVLAIRFADRFGKGLRTPPRDALIADSVSEKRRGLAFGIHRAGDTAGAAIGLGIAIVVVSASQGSANSLFRPTFQRLVLLSTIPAVLAVIVLVLGARDIAGTGKSETGLTSWKEALNPGFNRFLLAIGLFTLGNSSDAFIILRAQERGLTVLQLLLMILSFNIIYAITSAPAGALSDKVGRRKLVLISWLVYAVIYLGLGIAVDAWQVWMLFAVYGIYYGTSDGVSRALVADLVPDNQRGTAYGLYSALIGMAAFPASLLAGLLWQGLGQWSGLGPGAPFIFGSILAVIAAAVLSSVPKRETRPDAVSS